MLDKFDSIKDKLIKSFINIGYGYGFNFGLTQVDLNKQQLFLSEFNDNILASIKLRDKIFLVIKDSFGNLFEEHYSDYEYLFETYFKDLLSKYSNEEDLHS